MIAFCAPGMHSEHCPTVCQLEQDLSHDPTGPKGKSRREGRSRRQITGNRAIYFLSVHYTCASGFSLSRKTVDFSPNQKLQVSFNLCCWAFCRQSGPYSQSIWVLLVPHVIWKKISPVSALSFSHLLQSHTYPLWLIFSFLSHGGELLFKTLC